MFEEGEKRRGEGLTIQMIVAHINHYQTPQGPGQRKGEGRGGFAGTGIQEFSKLWRTYFVFKKTKRNDRLRVYSIRKTCNFWAPETQGPFCAPSTLILRWAPLNVHI